MGEQRAETFASVHLHRIDSLIGADPGIQHGDALFAILLAEDDREPIYHKPVMEIFGKVEPTVLPVDQLVVEAEEFILGDDLTREQYVDEVIPRRGLKKRLHQAERAAVWDACEAARAIMDERGSFFLSGVDTRNRSKTLEPNYRNTAEICDLSERYREQVPGLDRSVLGMGSSFRHGTESGFFVLPDAEAIWEAVLARLRFFLGRLGYAPENIAVLAPMKNFLKKADRLLSEAGIATCSVMDEDFDFETTEGVRLSTMHSAKGLEFPVVFLLLPMVLGTKGIDEEESAARMRNLVYVSMTRAMDNLQVFTTADGVEKNAVVGEVLGCISGDSGEMP